MQVLLIMSPLSTLSPEKSEVETVVTIETGYIIYLHESMKMCKILQQFEK